MKMYDIHSHMGNTSSGEQINPQMLIDNMKKFGIEKTGISCLSGVNNREQNDLVKTTMDLFPDLVLGYAFLNPKHPHVHDEIDLCLGEYGMVGVKFHPWKHGYFADNTPQIEDVLSHVNEYGAHCQIHVGMSPMATPFTWIRYAKKFSKLRFLLTHMGDRDFGYSVINAVKEIPNIWLETSVQYEVENLVMAKETIGFSRICFGTDWPYKSTECEIQKIFNLGFSDKELEHVFYKNAEYLWTIH